MKIDLRVPPKFPELDDVWEREDGVVFTWKGIGWIR